MDFFQNTCLKKATIWRLKNSHSNDKRLEKLKASSYHMEQKTYVEASCIYNTLEKVFFAAATFEGLWVV